MVQQQQLSEQQQMNHDHIRMSFQNLATTSYSLLLPAATTATTATTAIAAACYYLLLHCYYFNIFMRFRMRCGTLNQVTAFVVSVISIFSNGFKRCSCASIVSMCASPLIPALHALLVMSSMSSSCHQRADLLYMMQQSPAIMDFVEICLSMEASEMK